MKWNSRAMAPLPDLSRLPQGAAATGEFYPLPQDEADRLNEGGGVDLLTQEPYPARADRRTRLGDATFRLPYPESAPRNPDGSYRYRVYNAWALWQWVSQPGKEFDPADGAGPNRTRLLKSDWEALRDQFSTRRLNPTPDNSVFRDPIPNGLWPPRDPDAPPEVPEPKPAPLSQSVVVLEVAESTSGFADIDYVLITQSGRLMQWVPPERSRVWVRPGGLKIGDHHYNSFSFAVVGADELEGFERAFGNVMNSALKPFDYPPMYQDLELIALATLFTAGRLLPKFRRVPLGSMRGARFNLSR